MLTHRALLNGLSGIVDQGTRILVGFFLTPILVSYLGPSVFGVWQVIQKVSIQLTALDGRSSEVLKWAIANLQSKDDDTAKKQALAAALICALIFFPLLSLAYVIWVLYLPDYLNFKHIDAFEIQVAAIMLFVNMMFMTIAAIIEAVVRGMNMAYKLVGVLALVLVSSAVLTAYLVSSGYGLIYVAASQISIGFLSLILYVYVAFGNINWLGVRMPEKPMLYKALNRSAWFSSWGFINTWMLAGDVIVLGALVGADVVSKYVLTLYAAQMISVVILTAISAALPGLGGLVGNHEFERADKLRRESILYSWCLGLAICTTVIVINPSFVSLWVGEEHFSGYEVNFFMAICVFQLLFIRHDAFMLNLALDIKQKVLLGAVSAIVTLMLMLLLVPEYHLLGMCISLLLGRSILTVMYPRIISKFFRSKELSVMKFRHHLFAIALFIVAFELSQMVSIQSWILLVIYSISIMMSILLIIYFIVITNEQKNIVSNRFKIALRIR